MIFRGQQTERFGHIENLEFRSYKAMSIILC